MQKNHIFHFSIFFVLVGLGLTILTISSSSAAAVDPTPTINVREVARGLDAPVDIDFTGLPGDDRIFTANTNGTVRIGGASYFEPVLDISPIVDQQNEKGMLGLAFDPDFGNNSYFYVFYNTDEDENGVFNTNIERYTMSAEDPDFADPESATLIMQFQQFSEYHNGGNITFGPDGYLYIGVGDDNDINNSQDLTNLSGKILRIDVDPDAEGSRPADCDQTVGNYSIPADNPFVGQNACEEIWAYGLRNPWRFSFDQLTGDMFIGDVGGERTEELNFQPAGSPGGQYYGWPHFEGAECQEDNYPQSVCDSITNHTPPIFEYPHSAGGGSITGGFVYRGTAFPRMYGHYIFGDFTSSQIWTAINKEGAWEVTDQGKFAETLFFLSSFGISPDGEVYGSSLTNFIEETSLVYQIIDEFGFEISISAIDQATINDQIEYTLKIKNVGAETANSMVVENTIPENIAWVSGGIVSEGRVIWPITELASGASTTVTWVGQPTAGGVDIVNSDYQVSLDEWTVQGDTSVATSVVDGIFGRVFLDENQDGLLDSTEPGIQGVGVFMWEDSTCNGQTTSLQPVAFASSSESGTYSFPIENNTICYILQLNMDSINSKLSFSAVDIGDNESVDVDFYDNGWTAQIELPTQSVNAGLYDPSQPTPTPTPLPATETPTPEATETLVPIETITITPTLVPTIDSPAILDFFTYLPLTTR
ncbi:MAG: PQQ-dependent sugar dehydrogenase [Chloroflexota bacterium]